MLDLKPIGRCRFVLTIKVICVDGLEIDALFEEFRHNLGNSIGCDEILPGDAIIFSLKP